MHSTETVAVGLAAGTMVPGAVFDTRILDRAHELIHHHLKLGTWSRFEKQHYVWPRLEAIKSQRQLVTEQATRRLSRARGMRSAS